LNTAVGYIALAANDTGSSNTAVGGGAMLSNTTGSSNAALGVNALTNTSGTNNTAIGRYALYTPTLRKRKVLHVGYDAMRYADSGTAAVAL
jgi:hypothetical protein